jgi:uncharacterized protein
LKYAKIALFFITALLIWTSLNAYFLWRVETLPVFKAPAVRHIITVAVIFLALCYLIGRIFVHRGFGGFAAFLEITGAVWMGVLFIFVTYLFLSDIFSLFGYFKTLSINLRYIALVVAAILTIFSLFQGLRTPVVREEKIAVSNPDLAGLKIIQISDLHLGAINGERYLKRVVDKVNSESPDIVVITGDIIDTDGKNDDNFKKIFKELKTTKGVFAVLGNHEHYHGAEKNPAFFEEAGMALLRNKNTEVEKGLVIAGIDDLSARRQFKNGDDFLNIALKNKKDGYLILLSHSPLEVEEASKLGIDLMLSGHCHNGQIWPFTIFSKMVYPYNYGRYTVGGMTLVVTSGGGTWGPPMRLFRPSEMVKMTFEAK